MKKILLLISILACILLNAEIVTRQSIISQTKVYAEYSWKVNTPNPRYAQYKKQGTQITGEAYSYGDKDNTSAFQSDINAGVMPRNWKANHDDGHTTGYTGIDCSGLVTDCWDVSIHGGAALVGLCMELADSSLLKMGDAVRKPGHIQLYAWNDSVYEAVGSDQLDLWDWHKVRLSPATYKNRTFYSIFPQFSSPKPGNGYIVHLEDPNVTEYDIDIELTIRASGDIDNDEFVLKIDDEEIDETDYELIACLSVGYNEYRLDCSHTFEERGLHKVEVKAGNDKSNNIYVDEYEWSFFIGEGYGVFLIEPDFLYIPMGSNKDQKVELLYFPPDYCSTNPSGESYELNYSILGNFVSGWVTPNWSDYQGVIESTGEIKETWQYNIKNESDEEGSKNKITAKAYNDDDYLEVQAIVTSEDPEHAENHPDDAQLIAEGYYPTDRIYNPRSNIGVLLSGAGIGVSHIMGNFNTGICGVIPENFKVSGISGRQLEDLDVLIIGSAGIYVLNNPQLRERLHLWVENGGTVISMTSQFGFEWEYLPIPDGEQLDGYGWDEDQYCSKSSVYIEDRHPIISGQTNKILSMYVDGYIDKYPSNAKIPIKRTASTMPAAIEYQYGEGNVIITSDYVDWGYNHRQYFHDDLVFVRDMLKYGEIAGQYIEEITDYAQNQTNIDIDIKNNTSRTADKCVIKIFSPDNILLDSIIIDDMNLIGGGSYIHSAVINCEVRGIYTIKYILLNENNSIVQKENIYGGIVKYGLLDGGDYAENGLKMWCTSDKDKCILGDSVTVTAHLLNLQDDPFTGKIMIAIHEENGVWFDIVDSLYFENLESNEMVNHIYTFAPRKNTSVETGAYTQDKSYYTSGFKNSITGMIDRGIWIVKGAEIKLQTTVINDTIEPKQNILMERKIINKSDIDVNAKLITDINKLNVNDTKSLLISGLDTIIDTFSYETNVVLETQKINIVSYLTNGLNVNAIESNSVILKSLGFEVLCNAIINESQIGIYNYMKNTSTISINNIINAISLLEGNESILDSVFLLDSLRENEIYEDSIFSDYNDFKFGDYTLINTYILFDDTIIKEKKYLNKILFNFDLEKNTYTLLDTVKFTLCLVNTGDFYISPDLNIDLFAYNFQTNTGMMNPRDTLKYNFEIPLIDYYNASYNNKITLELNGSSITKEINCNVIPAKLFSRIIFDDTVSTGAVIDAKIINQGGLPANFTSTLRIIDSRGIIFDVDSINSSVGVLDSTDISLSLPEFINDDTYQIVLITVYNDKTNYSSKTIKINGISIAGNVYSQNDYYFTDTDKIGKIDFSSNSEIDTLLIDYKITNIGEEERINISGVSNLSNGQFDNTYLSPNYTGIGIAPKYLLDEEFEKRNFHYILKMDIDKKGNIYISDWGGKVFIMDNEGNYLKYIKTGLTNPYDMVVDDEFIYVGNAYNTIKCLIKEGGTRWTINSSASILDTKGDTIFITEYGCIGLLDRYSGELIDMWTYDIDEIYYGFYDEYYKAFIVLTSDKELLKINNSGEIFERDPLNTDIYLQYCSGIYSQNNGTFGMLYRNVDSEENILIDYSINRYGEIIQTNEIDGYPHGNNLNGYPGIGIRSAVNRNGILYFINDENRTVGAIENNKIIWHKNTLNIWYSDKCTTWLQTSNGNIYLAGEDGELLEYTNYTLSKTSGYIKNNWESNWGVELGEQIGVKDGNKIYLFDENLNKYDSIMVERNVDLICNSMDLSKFIFSTRLSPTIYNILIYNNNYEPMDSFQLNVTPHGWGWWFSGFISGMDIDAMDRMYFQDYWGEKAMIYDLSGNKINTINGDFYEGALFGGNNRVREFIVDDRDGISIRDITGNTLAELHTSYSYVPLMEEDKGIIIAENGKQMKRYNAYHKKSGTWIYLLDTENDDTYFENVTVDKYIPDGTSIEIKFRSSNDSSNIDNAIWSKWYNENEISLNGIQGRFLEIQAQLSTMDSTISPYLQGLGINTNLGTTYFAADTIISDISAGMQYSLDWNTLIPEQADEYYMKGKIRNKYEQLLYVEKDKFDVIDSDYAILLQTEKDDYKPYEDIALDIIIYNLTSTDDNFAFKLYKDNSLYLDTTIFISDSVIINKSFSDERSFNINTFLLLGDTICSKSKKIFIYAPDIMVELQCDDETYSEEMNANMLVKNIGVHPVLLNINFGDIFVTDSLYPDKQKSINNEFYVYSDTIINGFISGDIDLETQKQIKYQRKADINIQCNSKYTPQTIDFPYSFITNTEGKINLELRVLKDNNEIESINGLFYLNPDETRKLENTYIDSFGLGQNSFWGIDIDNDTTYITDIVNSELCIYDINMNLITKIPNIIGAAGIDIEDDKIYVTEAEDGSFKIYNKLYELENTVYGLGYPIDIEVIGDDIYIVDMDNTGIMHYNTNGDYLGCLGRESLDKPAGIEEYNGKIYVSDNLKNKIFIFDYTFGIIDSVTDNLYDIEGLAFDDFGYLYVGNSDNNTISVFSINGEFVYRTEPLKAVWADAYTIYNNKYYTLNNGDVFIYDFEGNEQLNYLSMDLQKGHYLITADISDERGLGKLSHREYEFDVYDGDTVNIDKFVVEADTIRTDGTFPVEFEVSNIGAETFSGSYRLSLGNVCIISDTLIIDVGMTRAVVHNIDIPFEVGEYDAELIIIKDKQNIAYNVLPFTAKTDFIFDYVYDNVTIMSGEFGKIPYGIRNRGIAYGSDYIKYDLGEFLRDSFNILLDRNDIYNDTLYLDIADDIPSGQYNGYIFTKNYRELLLFNVEGLDVSITHTLDKDAYRDGENAVFTMYYENNNNFCPSLYSYLRYNDFTDEGFNRVGGYADDLININNIGISGTGEYISGLFTIDDLGQRDSILFNIYSPLLLGNGINGFVRYSNSGLHFTDWDSLIGPGFLNIPNGQYYMQYKLALNQNTTIDSVVIGNKVLKGKDDFQMNEDSIKFTVPIAQAGNSLFYSVYTNYGRSILISNEYINRINDTIQVQLDKYLYNAGDTILVNIESEYTGKLEWNISGGMDSDPYGNWEITDTNTIKTIDIPLKSVSGFYTYNYTFLGFDTVINDSIIVTNSIPFNVKGYELSVKNIYIDKEQYYPGERVYADFDIIANRDMLVNIICYFKDENNNYSICYNDNRWINTGSEIIGIQTGDIPDIYGNCELIYKFYLIGLNKNMLMADGQKAFFVEDLTNPQFLMIDVAPCTLRTDVDDSVFAYFELSENCKVGYFTFNDITKVRTNILNGSVAWNIFEDGAQLHTGEYSVFAKAFDYAGNATIPVSRSVYVICEESDTIPPSTEFIVGEPKYLNDSIMYINGASTELNIISNDDDVMTIYYKINNGNWEEYNSGIILEQDGINVIQHYAEDITGNTGNIIYDSVYNDIYLPMASINVNEPYYNGYVSASTMIDVHLDDIGSGIETGTLTINDDSVHLTDTSYMFNLQAPSGEKDLSVSVYDNVGNANEINQMLFLDTDMPSCSMYITGSQYMQYLGNDASINITSSDAISGLKGSFLIINYDTIYGFDEIHFPVSGIELINCEYYSIDNVLNMSEIGMDAFIGDYTPPVTELAISNDYYYSDREYVSSRSVLTLSAEDDASGVDTTIMTINGECADINNSVLTVYGLNSVEYYSIDNVENTEDINARAIYMDNVVPDYSLSFDGEYIDSVPYIVNMNTQITINGTDDLSGVRYIHYSIDNTNNTIIGNSLNIPEEGLHTLYIKLSDNVNNITGWQSEAVYVDNTPPEVSVEIGLPKYNDYITSESPIKLIASDEIAGVRRVTYYINGDEYTYNEPFTITGPDGEYTIGYRAVDKVGNESELQSITVNLDNTSPEITINYNEPQYYGDYQFVSSQSLIDIEAYDTGSGQKRITYDINEILSGEGASALTISLINLDENVYNLLVKAWDNLDNEAEKQDEFVIDDSHPLTNLAIGDPQYIKSDTMLMTSNTPLELTAADKPDNTPASGVYEMIYGHISPLNHVNNSNYTDYVNDEDGVYQYRYYSVDNLDNTEPVNERTIELDNTAPEVIITYPYDGIFINQDVTIKGYADDKNFRRWKLEYKIEEALSWNTITDWQTTVPSDSSLGQFNASELQSGVYTVKLTAEDLVENMNTYEITIKVGEPQQDLELTGYLKPEGVWGGDYIYIADTQHKRVVKTNEDNSLLLEIREFQPRDVFIDSRGRIFTTDLDNKVYVYSSQGDEIKTIDGHLHPKGVEVRFNKIYAADTYKNRIVVYNMNGEIDMTIPVNKHPEGIAVDEDGNIFTCIDESNEIRGYSSTGEEIFRYGVVGHGLGEFVRAVDIDVDSKGYLWVCDRNNNRIHMIDWRNELDLFILGERGQEERHKDGMNKPAGLSVVEEDGEIKYIYIADTNNDRIIRYNMSIVATDRKAGIASAQANGLEIEQFLPYPNPTSDESTIRVVLSQPAELEINIFTLTGKLVYNYSETGNAGINEVIWTGINADGTDVLNGVYNIQVRATSGNSTVERWSKIALIR